MKDAETAALAKNLNFHFTECVKILRELEKSDFEITMELGGYMILKLEGGN